MLWLRVVASRALSDARRFTFSCGAQLGELLCSVFLQQLACLGTGKFHLLGANLSAPLMKFTALAARNRGTRPCKLVLIDPLPAPPYTPVAGKPYLLADGVDAKYVAEGA